MEAKLKKVGKPEVFEPFILEVVVETEVEKKVLGALFYSNASVPSLLGRNRLIDPAEEEMLTNLMGDIHNTLTAGVLRDR